MQKSKIFGLVPGVFFKILNLNLFCLFSIVLFYIGHAVPTATVFLCINIIGAIILLPVALIQKVSFCDLTKNFRTFILRGLFNSVGVCSWVFAMRYIGPNEATAITFIIPIFTLILSAIFCNDKFHYNIIIALFTCIVGASIILYPKINMEFTALGCFYAIVSSCCWASYDIICKIQSKSEGAFTQTFKNNIYSAIVVYILSFLLNIDFVGSLPSVGENIVYILAASVISIMNITVLFCAYRATKVSNLMPLGYLRLFFMAIYTYFLFGDVIHINTVIGGAIIFSTNFFIFRFNLKQAKLSAEN